MYSIRNKHSPQCEDHNIFPGVFFFIKVLRIIFNRILLNFVTSSLVYQLSIVLMS